MKTNQYVTDTHSLVWYFTESSRLSRKALKVFEKTVKEGAIIIPTVVLAEIMYISKKWTASTPSKGIVRGKNGRNEEKPCFFKQVFARY